MMLSLLVPDSVLITPRREGSRALAEVRERIYSTITGLDVSDLEDSFSLDIIAQLLEFNFGEDAQPARLKAQLRPTDRREILLNLIVALIRAKDSIGAQKLMAVIAIKEILAELGISTNLDEQIDNVVVETEENKNGDEENK